MIYQEINNKQRSVAVMFFFIFFFILFSISMISMDK